MALQHQRQPFQTLGAPRVVPAKSKGLGSLKAMPGETRGWASEIFPPRLLPQKRGRYEWGEMEPI